MCFFFFFILPRDFVRNHGSDYHLFVFIFFTQAFLDITSASSRDSGRGSLCGLTLYLLTSLWAMLDLCLRVNRKTTQRKLLTASALLDFSQM
jgi:hypothetical protein